MGELKKSELFMLSKKWPSAFVARRRIFDFTGGIIDGRTVANLDSLGKGPPGRVRIGKIVAYDVLQFISWLEARAVKDAPYTPPGPRNRRRKDGGV